MRRFFFGLSLAFLAAFACGRTEPLDYAPTFPDGGLDAGKDAGPDGGKDAGRDAGPDAGVDAGPCQPRVVPLVPAVPMVMFVVDRSGSMRESLGNDGGPSKWSVLQTSLRQTLTPRDRDLATGALFYPTASSSSCSAPTSVDLSPALGNVSRMLSLMAVTPTGGTPTAQAIDVAATHLRNVHAAGTARALVLTTDGAPNCNAALNTTTCTCTQARIGNPPRCPSSTACLDDVQVLTRLSELYQRQRVPTYVVGLGLQQGPYAPVLDRMAVAGGVARTDAGHLYYAADSQAELTEAFTRITAQLSRCTFLSVTRLGPRDRFVVRVGASQIPQTLDGGTEGWEWLDEQNGEFTLRGTACDRAAAGEAATALVACD